jgi:hypothetical protein
MLQDIVRGHPGSDMDEATGLVAAIRDQVTTLDALTEEYLAFARFPKPHFEDESITTCWRSWAAFVRPVATRQGLTIHVADRPRRALAGDRPRAVAPGDPQPRENAMEALSRGGALTIESRCDGDAVEIAVSDTGGGITLEVGQHLFEPFFTTKPQGTGLGLSITRQIIEEHGGDLAWRNREGGRRHLRHPPADQEAGEPCLSPPRLLVADDDPGLRESLDRTLTREGYRIVLASDGRAALERFQAGGIDLIVTDLKMPGPHRARAAASGQGHRPRRRRDPPHRLRHRGRGREGDEGRRLRLSSPSRSGASS